MKTCVKCLEKKDINCFSKRSKNVSGLNSKCKGCCSEEFKQWASKNKESLSFNKRERRRTLLGLLSRMYDNMNARVSGRGSPHNRYLYINKEIIDKKTFIDFATKDTNFNSLFESWKDSGYIQKLTPTPDRIDSNIGYLLNNIVFITMSENSKRANRQRQKVPKDVMTKRTHEELTQKERNIAIDSFRDLPKAAIHDGYDAIGIGRWYIKKESK